MASTSVTNPNQNATDQRPDTPTRGDADSRHVDQQVPGTPQGQQPTLFNSPEEGTSQPSTASWNMAEPTGIAAEIKQRVTPKDTKPGIPGAPESWMPQLDEMQTRMLELEAEKDAMMEIQ